ncbi:GTSE1 protein, partial [Turnix velox]|nr:GTSE1 protein [Turnix velox]
SSENDDEVFVGPLGHKEKCIAVNIEAAERAEKKGVPTYDKLKWSPLIEEDLGKVFEEANLLALQISTGSKNEQTQISQLQEQENKVIEQFVKDSKSKLEILRNQNTEKSPRSVKRETYCVQDHPPCQLPPCFQKESDKLLPRDKVHALHTSPVKIASSPLTQEQKTKESNPNAAGKLPKAKISSTLGKGNFTFEKLKPGKHTSISTKRDLISVASSEDLISDRSSIASDIFESPLSGSSSVQGKKALPAPIKPGLKKTNLKLPGVTSGLPRKTISSSLSSVTSVNSSLNSSLPFSPIGKNGKMSISLKTGVSGPKLSSSTSIQALVRPTKVSSLQAANAEKSRKQPRSASTPKISGGVSLEKPSASAAVSEATGGGIQRPSSVPSQLKICQQNKGGSATKSLCLKPGDRVLSVPANETQILEKTGDTPSNKWAPKPTSSLGLTFRGTVGSAMAASTPVKASEDGILSNSCFSERSVFATPASVKRSGLPTSISRISGFAAATPKTTPRKACSTHAPSIHQGSCLSNKKILTVGSKQTNESKTLVSSEDDISPPPVIPFALNFSPEKNDTEVVDNKLKEAEVSNQLSEEKQTEAILIDIGIDKSAPRALEYESRPLIDLANTPEVNKITPLKPAALGHVKLIDLSSPLIILSPDVNKENLDSPLLKF